MTSPFAVATAGILQVFLRTSFFIKQHVDLCSNAPTSSSWIFLLAFLDILSDIQIFPLRYMHLPYIIQVLVETVLAVLMTEFAVMFLWCAIENFFCTLVTIALLRAGMSQRSYTRWEPVILGVTTTALSLIILTMALKATDHIHTIKKKFIRFGRKVSQYIKKARGYFKRDGNAQANECENLRIRMQKSCACAESGDGLLQRHSPRRRRGRSRKTAT